MRKATGKIGLLLILCMFASMLPASVATGNSEWLAGAAEPADETPAADSFVYASAPSGDYIALSSEDLAASTARDILGPADIPDIEPVSGTFDSSRVSWEFNPINRTLTIKKTGADAGEMPSFDDTDIPWKSYRDEITTIEIDSGITTTEPRTFSGYSILSSVTVPNNWTYFKGELNILSDVDNASLAVLKELVTKVVIKADVRSIADNAFAGMNNLTDSGDQRQPVVYFEGTQDQWKAINSNCTGAWGLKAEDNKYLLVSFQDGSLIGTCGKAAPDDATFVFDGTDTLTISGNGRGSAEMDAFTSRTMPWYSVRGKIKTLNIGADIKTIGSYAFYSCIALTGVEISENVTSIGSHAFAKCANLENLTIKGGAIPLKIGMYAFWECGSLKDIGSPATTEGARQPGIAGKGVSASSPAQGESVPNGGAPSGKRFTDVAPDAWYYEAANWAYDQKIAKGEGGKRLNPNKLCTRAEMLTFLWRALGSPAPSGTGKTFIDVSSGAYYARAVQWAAGRKIVKGEGGKRFNPDAPVTRGEAITLLYRAIGVPASSGARFNDVPESAYYAEAVEWAVSRDIAKGMGKRSFSPATPCTRAQVLTFLYRSQS